MSLTRCIKEYWGNDDFAPFPCILQLIHSQHFGSRPQWWVQLNDGECISSHLVYAPEGDVYKHLPLKYSVIKIVSTWGFDANGRNYFVFEDFDIIKENTGRIEKFGNPWYPLNDFNAVQDYD